MGEELGVRDFERAVAVAKVGGAALDKQCGHVLPPGQPANLGAIERDPLRSVRELDVHGDHVARVEAVLKLGDDARAHRASGGREGHTARNRRVPVAVKQQPVGNRDVELRDSVRRAQAVGELDVTDERVVSAVDESVAVVVDSVVDLGRVRVDVLVGVVAIVAVGYVAEGRRTTCEALERVAVPVAIEIVVPRGLILSRSVAVVVDSVADFGFARVDRRIAVVAVVTRCREKTGHVVARRH